MMSFLEIKPEPLGEEVDGSHDEHLNERVNDFSKICFDYEDPDQDKIPIKEEIKEEIKHEPMTIDNMDDDLHVIDVENDQEKSELQSIIDKLLIEKHILQKDIDKLVELQVENQILKSEKRLLEDKIKTFEELQVENQTLKSEKQYMERKLEEKEKKFQELSLHSAQLQSTILNLKENEDNHPKKLDKSDITQNMENCEANEEEPAVLQAEEFNISDPMTSSNCSNSGTTESQNTVEQSTITYSDNDSPEENKRKGETWLYISDSDTEEDEDHHYNKKSKSKEHSTINGKRMPRSTRKDIRYDDEDESSHDISSDSGSDKDYCLVEDRIHDETDDDDISNIDNTHQIKRHILKKTNSKVTPLKKNQVKRKQDHSRPIRTAHKKQRM